jgi:hypothetical protein
LVIGVILAAVLNARSNAGAILAVGTTDFIIHTFFQPDGQTPLRTTQNPT